jgi:hypothetical protein
MRITHKKIKEAGWDKFIEWAIVNGWRPDDLELGAIQTAWIDHRDLLKIASDIEKDLYGQQGSTNQSTFVGLSKLLR